MWRTENAMRSVEVTRARRSDALFQWQEDGRKVGGGRGVTLSPVKLRNIPREILQLVCAGSSGTISHFAERPRHVANNEDRWRGLWRPDTVPRLLIGRINQRFHPVASHLFFPSSCRFPLFVSRSERDLPLP